MEALTSLDGVRWRAVANLSRARRDRPRNATIAWTPVQGAVGYNGRWEIAPTKLCHTYQRFAGEGATLELRALTVGQRYWVAIEGFDESEVSTLSVPVEIR